MDTMDFELTRTSKLSEALKTGTIVISIFICLLRFYSELEMIHLYISIGAFLAVAIGAVVFGKRKPMGKMLCFADHIEILYGDGKLESFQIDHIDSLVFYVSKYKGQSIGLTFFVASGHENRFKLNYQSVSLGGNFFVESIAVRQKLISLGEVWRRTNPKVKVVKPVGA